MAYAVTKDGSVMYGEMRTITELTGNALMTELGLWQAHGAACDAGTTVNMPRRTRYDS